MAYRKQAMDELTGRFARIQHTGRLGESFTRISGAVRALEDLHSNRDLTQTAESHTAKVGRAAQTLEAKLPGLKESALTAWSNHQASISEQIVTRCNFKPSRFEAEIRQVLLSMPSLADRIAWLQEAAQDDNNGPIIAAVSEAPPALTGVNKEALKAIEDDFVARLCPDLVEQREDLNTALDLISASHRTAETMAREYQDVQALERIAQAEAASRQAQERMNEALA
jgi:hypothetical protein